MSNSENTNEAKWRSRAFKSWAIVGACVVVGVIIYICQILWQAVAVIIVTLLTVFLLHGIVKALEERGIPRWAGTTISFLGVIVIFLGCIIAVIPAVIEQLTAFVNQMPDYTESIEDTVRGLGNVVTFVDSTTINNGLQELMSFIRQQAGSVASGLANGLIGGLVSLGNVVLIVFISMICSFWILLDLPTITRELRSIISEKYQDDVDVFTNALGTAVYGWAKSTLLCALITGVVSFIAFFLLGIPYSAVLGLFCGILYFIPYIGPMVSCALVAVVALIASPLTCLLSIVFNVVLNNVVGNVISPKLMKSSVNVYPALILIAILIGSALGGIPGMLLSIPIIGTMQGLFVAYYEAHTGKTISTDDGVLFQLQKKSGLPKLKKKAKPTSEETEGDED